MFVSAPKGSPGVIAKRGAGEDRLPYTLDDATSILVPFLSPVPRAGKGCGNALNDYVIKQDAMEFNLRWLRESFGVSPQNLCIMRVGGDSMAPAINDGELIFIEGITDRPDYRDGLWALSLGGRLFVKRVQMLANGRLEAASDNPAYKPLKLDGPAHLLGRVVGGPPKRF
jgi:phage repressor protein C with HTH and peptisase S24 domain